MSEYIKADPKTLYNIAYKTFLSQGVPEEDAALAADVLNLADRRGVNSHGLNRIWLYLYPLMAGVYAKSCELEILRDGGSTLMLDAKHAMGIVAAPRAMQMTIDRARKHGVCVCGVRNSGHLGITGYYTLMAANEGLLGFALSGTPPLMVPWGGRIPTLSNSPWSMAFPGGTHYPDPVMLDMANTQVAGGKVELAIRAGKKIPLDWGLDETGHPTDDPNTLWKSQAFLPFGGIKGYCLGVMWDLLSSVLTGGGFGGTVMKDLESPGNFGHLFAVLDPGCFRDKESMTADLDRFTAMIKETPLAEGSEEILLPGEPEVRNYARSEKEGINFDKKLANELTALLIKAGTLPEGAGIDDLMNL